MIFDFLPVEWGLIGFAGFMFLLGIYYIIQDEQKQSKARRTKGGQ